MFSSLGCQWGATLNPSGVLMRMTYGAPGDDADNPRFVETLPRRGYRFIAPVEALTPGPNSATQARLSAALQAGSRAPAPRRE